MIDTNANRAVIRSGVAPGELVVLSPLSKNRISITLKVLDINNPNKVLVDPPKPDWLKQLENKNKTTEKGKTKKRRWGKKSTKEDTKEPKKPLKKSDTPPETENVSEAQVLNQPKDASKGDQP